LAIHGEACAQQATADENVVDIVSTTTCLMKSILSRSGLDEGWPRRFGENRKKDPKSLHAGKARFLPG
jgi:hypothetical protein